MNGPVQFPYTQTSPGHGPAGYLPLVPVVLQRGQKSANDQALVDSGSVINVLPYDLGLQLGLDWNQQPVSAPLGGMLASAPARLAVLGVAIGPFAPVVLGFARTRATIPRTILGQVNFFLNFDVLFARTRGFFEISPAAAPAP